MPTAVHRAHKNKADALPYKRIKIHTTKGQRSTISLDKTLYEVIENKVGAKATQAIAQMAARQFDQTKTSKTKKTRSAYVVQALRRSFGLASPRPDTSQKYTYARFRVRDPNGNLTTVSLDQAVIARMRHKLTLKQIRAIAEAAALTYEEPTIFTRSEHIKRAFKTRLGEQVPTETQLLRRKFHLSRAQLASILHVSPEDVARWEERGKIDSGPARMMIAMLWKKELRLSAVLKKGQPT